MRNYFILLAFLCAQIASAQIQYHDDDICKIALHEKKHHAHFLNNKAGALSTDFDVKHHRLSLSIDPEQFYVSGYAQCTFSSVVTSLTQIHLDCDTNLVIDSVHAQGTLASHRKLAGHVLQIDLPSPVSKNSIDSVRIFYHGIPTGSGFGSFVQGSHNVDSIIWTLSEPYGAREWWPCKQDLNDKIDSVDIIVHCPIGNKVASNGLLIDTNTTGTNITYHWKHRYPIPAYLVSIAVTNYAEYSEFVNLTTGQLEILNYVYPEDSATLVTQSPQLFPFLELFDTLFEPYPYMKEKYGHAQWGWGGGMEHSTMSSMGGFGYELLAHELAHQWFGNKITCGAWQDIWLNEGFASYLTGLTYNYLSPNLYWPLWKRIQVDKITAQPDGSVWVDDTTSVSRIFSSRLSYRKASMLLHMLRWKLGDTDFYQSIRNYLADPKLAWGYARTADLKTHLETVSGQNLTEFFNDWFYGEGHPIYRIEWSQGPGGLWVNLQQSTSDPSVGLFEMPVPIRFKGTNGDTTLVFNQTQNNQLFKSHIQFQADSVFFDPDIWLVAQVDTILTSTPEAISSEREIKIYPNPGEGIITIEGSNAAVNVTDQTGKLVLDHPARPANNQNTTIDLSGLSRGIYFISIDSRTFKYILTNK